MIVVCSVETLCYVLPGSVTETLWTRVANHFSCNSSPLSPGPQKYCKYTCSSGRWQCNSLNFNSKSTTLPFPPFPAHVSSSSTSCFPSSRRIYQISRTERHPPKIYSFFSQQSQMLVTSWLNSADWAKGNKGSFTPCWNPMPLKRESPSKNYSQMDQHAGDTSMRTSESMDIPITKMKFSKELQNPPPPPPSF